MDIKLKPKGKKAGAAFYFPSLPESIQAAMGASMQSVDVISKGTVKYPKGTVAREVKWSGEFFGKSKRKEPIVKKKRWKSPKKCVGRLRGWMENGTALNLVISGTWINMDVAISSFDVEEYGAYGNIRYSITLTQRRALKIYTTKELKTPDRKVKERESADSGGKGNYVVASGDTLWGIAASHCGGGANWTKLYDANAETIEAEARKHGKANSDHGHWIWPGEILALV